MKLLEIRENEKIIHTSNGWDDDITSPVTIEFTIDKKTLEKLEQVTGHYKWSIYDALSMFCRYSEELVTEMELDIDHKFREPSDPEEDEFWNSLGSH